MMTDSPLATPTLALQCDHPPIARTVVQAPPSVLVPQCEPTTPLLLHAAYRYMYPTRRGFWRGRSLLRRP